MGGPRSSRRADYLIRFGVMVFLTGLASFRVRPGMATTHNAMLRKDLCPALRKRAATYSWRGFAVFPWGTKLPCFRCMRSYPTFRD
jgi:hypothetical protein